MNALLLVFPRVKDMGNFFTGCQSIWRRSEGLTTLLVRLEFKAGELIAMRDPSTTEVCHYRAGKLVGGSPVQCANAGMAPLRSLAPGCIAKLSGFNEPAPKECERYE